jgi:hypothetical protein
MKRILDIFQDPANTAELMLLMLCLTLLALCAIALGHARYVAWRNRYRFKHTPSTLCERAGSTESFHRLMRAKQL